ncbi:MAG: ribosome biogenesis GTPase Der [Candidatus Margulisiibacteriota bacterium]
MTHIPEILIIGRPNVGKSTLINHITKSKKAITLDQPGITRDLVSYPVSWQKKSFFLVDSAGLMLEKHNPKLQDKVEEKIVQKLAEVDRIILVVDCQAGLLPTDKDIAKQLYPFQDKVTLVANKADSNTDQLALSEFLKLGFGEALPISATQGKGVALLLSSLTQGFPEPETDVFKTTYRIALVGRPNAGKSSLINAIVRKDVMIVDETAGTTRDSADVFFKTHGNTYVFVDTAGMRKKANVEDGLEFYSVVRASKAIAASDIVVVVLSSENYLEEQDRKIIRKVLDEHRNMIVFINKCDLITPDKQAHMKAEAEALFPALVNYPMVFGSAKDSKNISKVLDLIPSIITRSQRRIPTPQLNNFVEQVVKRNPPPAKYGKKVTIYYATQTEVAPPSFVFFVNHTENVKDDYLRFLERRLRDYFGELEGVPIRLFFKGHRDKKA